MLKLYIFVVDFIKSQKNLAIFHIFRLLTKFIFEIIVILFERLAQLDRALAPGAKGCEFDSHISQLKLFFLIHTQII